MGQELEHCDVKLECTEDAPDTSVPVLQEAERGDDGEQLRLDSEINLGPR